MVPLALTLPSCSDSPIEPAGPLPIEQVWPGYPAALEFWTELGRAYERAGEGVVLSINNCPIPFNARLAVQDCSEQEAACGFQAYMAAMATLAAVGATGAAWTYPNNYTAAAAGGAWGVAIGLAGEFLTCANQNGYFQWASAFFNVYKDHAMQSGALLLQRCSYIEDVGERESCLWAASSMMSY